MASFGRTFIGTFHGNVTVSNSRLPLFAAFLNRRHNWYGLKIYSGLFRYLNIFKEGRRLHRGVSFLGAERIPRIPTVPPTKTDRPLRLNLISSRRISHGLMSALLHLRRPFHVQITCEFGTKRKHYQQSPAHLAACRNSPSNSVFPLINHPLEQH